MHIVNLKEKYLGKCVLAALCLMMSLAIVTKPVVSAASSISRSYSGSFAKAWERYASSGNGQANLTYGYNTFLINEDYAWAKHNTKSHYAAIKNGKGWHTGSGKAAGKTSKIEVTHKGSTVSYFCYY